MKHLSFGHHKSCNDMPDADRTLQNIFEACNVKPNTVSFKELVSHARENTVKYIICMMITAAALIFTFFIPLLFKPSASSRPLETDIAVESSSLENGNFTLHLTGSMIDYTSIYAIDEENEKVYPTSYDVRSGEVDFRYNNESWNIYIPDLNGSQLHLLLTPKD